MGGHLSRPQHRRSKSRVARRTRTPAPPDDDFTENIVDIDVSDEMQGSYLEYA
jgi:hypothetical protein